MIFFLKKELLLGLASKTLRPLAPVCVRPEMYSFNVNTPKDNDVFYSGRIQEKTQADRGEVVSLFGKHFSSSMIIGHGTQKTFLTVSEYLGHMARSKFILSPSGISWDSVRLTEAGLTPNAVLIAPKPYIETTGPKLIDGENAILYDVELEDDGKYHLKNGNGLIEKVNHLLKHDDERERMAKKWHDDVLAGHTIRARSQYILDSIEKIMK